MQYVFVETRGSPLSGKENYLTAIMAQVDICLFSLIGGLRQTKFGMDTLIGVAHDIEAFRSRYLAPYGKKILIDSGGYSIIVGDVVERDIGKLIGCYNEYQVKALEAYDFIMSLDIPLIIGNKSFNTMEKVYRFNRQSLADTKENLINYKELRDKLYFIWQFKTKEHFAVWNRIVQELDLNSYVKHRALGGMVSLRGITEIDFSPFIANAFRCFFDYENSPDPADEFRLHFLGINIKYDRFTIALLEKLFERYMGDHRKAVLSYDSINYSISAQRKIKSLEIYQFVENTLSVFRDIPSVPESILKRVYPGDLLGAIQEEIGSIKGFRKVYDIGAFAALNVFSNQSIDRYLEHIIDDYELIDLMLNHRNGINFVNRIRSVFNELSEKHPYLFTTHMVKSIKKNLSITLDFHNWYKFRRDIETLDRKIYRFIEKIGFPRVLM